MDPPPGGYGGVRGMPVEWTLRRGCRSVELPPTGPAVGAGHDGVGSSSATAGRGRRTAATVTPANPATTTMATATDVAPAIRPIRGEASRKPSRAPAENEAIP